MPPMTDDIIIPDGRFSRESFQHYLIENYHALFLPGKKRKWIKIHGVRVKPDEWKDMLGRYLIRELGDVWHIGLPIFGNEQPNGRERVDFYICNYSPELLLFYTASTNWEYERSLRKLTDETLGLGRMWIGPKRFEDLVLHFMDRFNPTLERFIARRTQRDTLDAKLRPEMDRRVNWTAMDSFDTLWELRDLYGVRPTSVVMRMHGGKIQLNNDGMFVITRATRDMFAAFEDAMSLLKEEQVSYARTSQKMELVSQTIRTDAGEIVVPKLTSGTILLQKMKLDSAVIKKIESSAKFDFVESSPVEGSFSWVSTAIDKDKKSVFGINSNDTTINLVPRFNTTFESFLDFYRQILEEVDPTAKFQIFGGLIER